jgi:hypothetical protein
MNAATVLAPDATPARPGTLGLPPCPRVPTKLGAYDDLDEEDAGWLRERRFRQARNALRDPRDPAFEEDLAEPEDEPC